MPLLTLPGMLPPQASGITRARSLCFSGDNTIDLWIHDSMQAFGGRS